MPKYLIAGNYVGEGVKGLLKEGGSGRKKEIENLVKSVGGTVEDLYYAFGDTNIFFIVDLPDNASMAALSLVVNASGTGDTKVVVLMTPEEMDEAVKKTVNYRPPGQ